MEFNETIPGSYTLVTMPDGSEVMMHRLADGTWVTTAERAKQEETADFMARFAGTDFVPAPHSPQTEGTLRPVDSHTGTRNRVEAYLIEIMGDPQLISAGDLLALDRVKKVRARPQEMRHVLGLIGILHKPEWDKVKTVLLNERS